MPLSPSQLQQQTTASRDPIPKQPMLQPEFNSPDDVPVPPDDGTGQNKSGGEDSDKTGNENENEDDYEQEEEHNSLQDYNALRRNSTGASGRISSGILSTMDVIEKYARNTVGLGYLSDLGMEGNDDYSGCGEEDRDTETNVIKKIVQEYGNVLMNSFDNDDQDDRERSFTNSNASTFSSSSMGAASWYFENSDPQTSQQNRPDLSVTKLPFEGGDDHHDAKGAIGPQTNEKEVTDNNTSDIKNDRLEKRKKVPFNIKGRGGIGRIIHRNKANGPSLTRTSSYKSVGSENSKSWNQSRHNRNQHLKGGNEGCNTGRDQKIYIDNDVNTQEKGFATFLAANDAALDANGGATSQPSNKHNSCDPTGAVCSQSSFHYSENKEVVYDPNSFAEEKAIISESFLFREQKIERSGSNKLPGQYDNHEIVYDDSESKLRVFNDHGVIEHGNAEFVRKPRSKAFERGSRTAVQPFTDFRAAKASVPQREKHKTNRGLQHKNEPTHSNRAPSMVQIPTDIMFAKENDEKEVIYEDDASSETKEGSRRSRCSFGKKEGSGRSRSSFNRKKRQSKKKEDTKDEDRSNQVESLYEGVSANEILNDIRIQEVRSSYSRACHDHGKEVVYDSNTEGVVRARTLPNDRFISSERYLYADTDADKYADTDDAIPVQKRRSSTHTMARTARTARPIPNIYANTGSLIPSSPTIDESCDSQTDGKASDQTHCTLQGIEQTYDDSGIKPAKSSEADTKNCLDYLQSKKIESVAKEQNRNNQTKNRIKFLRKKLQKRTETTQIHVSCDDEDDPGKTQRDIELVVATKDVDQNKLGFWRPSDQQQLIKGDAQRRPGRSSNVAYRSTRSKRTWNPERLLCSRKHKEQREKSDRSVSKNNRKLPQSSTKQEIPFNGPAEIHDFVFSDDRNDEKDASENLYQKTENKLNFPMVTETKEEPLENTKNALNTSMETATTMGTEEDSLCQIEVEDISTMSRPLISTLLREVESSPKSTESKTSRPDQNVLETYPSVVEYVEYQEVTAGDINTTPVELQDEKTHANDSAYILEDIALGVPDTVHPKCFDEAPNDIEGILCRVSTFVEEVLEKNNFNAIVNDKECDVSYNPSHMESNAFTTEANDVMERSIVKMLGAPCIFVSSNDKEYGETESEKEDSFPFIGSSIAFGDALPTISFDLDAPLLSWDLETVLDGDCSQSRGSEVCDYRELTLEHSLPTDLPQLQSDESKLLPNVDKANGYESFSSILGNLPYRAAKTTVSKPVVDEKVAPASESKKQDVPVPSENNKSDDDGDGDCDEDIHSTGSLLIRAEAAEDSKQTTQDEIYSPQLQVPAEEAENENPSTSVSHSGEIRRTLRFVFDEGKPLSKQTGRTRGTNSLRTDKKRNSPPKVRRVPQVLPSTRTNATSGHTKTTNPAPRSLAAVTEARAKMRHSVQQKRSQPPKGEQVPKTLKPASTKVPIARAVDSDGFPIVAEARPKAQEAGSDPKSLETNRMGKSSTKVGGAGSSNENSSSNNNNYVVDKNGFLVDTTTAVLEDLEESFESNQQHKWSQRLRTPSPSTEASGEKNDSTSHRFVPQQAYWKLLKNADPVMLEEYRRRPSLSK